MPYWWDKTIDALAATILQIRPDIPLLFSGSRDVSSIPERPPTFAQQSSIGMLDLCLLFYSIITICFIFAVVVISNLMNSYMLCVCSTTQAAVPIANTLGSVNQSNRMVRMSQQ